MVRPRCLGILRQSKSALRIKIGYNVPLFKNNIRRMKYLGGFVTAPLLQVEQLECERDDRVLIKNLSFELYNGEILQVEGANGSGKTTLLRVLCGLSDEFQGELTWCGRPRRRVEADFRRQTLY